MGLADCGIPVEIAMACSRSVSVIRDSGSAPLSSSEIIETAAPKYRGRVHPDYATQEFEEGLARLAAICDAPPAPEDVLLDSRNKVVAAALPVGPGRSAEVVIKRFRTRGLSRLKTVAVRSKARKAWSGAAACLERGVATPLPLAFLERRERGIVTDAFYVSLRLGDAPEIRGLLRNLRDDELTKLIAQLAAWLRDVHGRGVLHRDLSDGNVLVVRDEGGGIDFRLIDTNRVRGRRRISRPARLRNLVRLGVPADRRREFLAAYSGGAEPGRTDWVLYSVMKSSYAGFVAAKKRLRLRRLAERLKIQ